ncbi:hypothetical protein BH20ACT21_BH20ACT21_24340 [soil metagenome]
MNKTEGLEHLEALKQTHDRVTEVMLMMEPLVRVMAAEGNPLAGYVIDQLEEARVAMKSENVGAGAFLAEAGRG